MTKQTELVAYSNTTDKAQLQGLTDGMLAALALQNLPELGEGAELTVGGREDVIERLGISSVLYKNGAESISISLDGREAATQVSKPDNTPKFDG